MIDIKVLREDPELVRVSQRARGEDEAVVDAVLAADEQRRSALSEYEALKAEQNRANKAMGSLMGRLRQAQKQAQPAGGGDLLRLQAEVDQARAAGTQLSARVKDLDAGRNEAEAQLNTLIRRIGNVALEGVPVGGEDDFKVLETVGTPRDFRAEGFEPRDHVELLEGLGGLDLARGAKVAESRFYYLMGQGVRLEQAMLNLALDRAYDAGFTQLGVPTLVNHHTMEGAGFLDTHADEVYKLGTDELYLTGTSEVALAGLHTDEILDLSSGPKRYTACSTCYRREAGSYGRDTRGIIRVHQFQKVEMFVYCRPGDAVTEHAALLGHERAMLDLMEIPYRVIDIAAGDLGGPAARKFDCEGWVPTQDKYRELTSTSNCTTFQARRLGIREKAEGVTSVVATLNGTLATTRWLVAILENHQQADGSVVVPAALRPYLRTDRLVPGAR
ncbi:MAG: serine--tRNA ligase [Micrococcales bacterium]|nr:serine--tRNA ligase [Micrococcales bacterium]